MSNEFMCVIGFFNRVPLPFSFNNSLVVQIHLCDNSINKSSKLLLTPALTHNKFDLVENLLDAHHVLNAIGCIQSKTNKIK